MKINRFSVIQIQKNNFKINTFFRYGLESISNGHSFSSLFVYRFPLFKPDMLGCSDQALTVHIASVDWLRLKQVLAAYFQKFQDFCLENFIRNKCVPFNSLYQTHLQGFGERVCDGGTASSVYSGNFPSGRTKKTACSISRSKVNFRKFSANLVINHSSQPRFAIAAKRKF